MRQGPKYNQHFEYDNHGRPIITVPLELVSDFENCEYVQWTNNNGVFTLKVFDIYPD